MQTVSFSSEPLPCISLLRQIDTPAAVIRRRGWKDLMACTDFAFCTTPLPVRNDFTHTLRQQLGEENRIILDAEHIMTTLRLIRIYRGISDLCDEGMEVAERHTTPEDALVQQEDVDIFRSMRNTAQSRIRTLDSLLNNGMVRALDEGLCHWRDEMAPDPRHA